MLDLKNAMGVDCIYMSSASGSRFLLIAFFFVFSFCQAFSQQNVGIGTASPDNSALLDLVSTTKGFLMPRMTTVQRNAIASPASGLLIYNSTNSRYEFNAGTSGTPNWIPLITLPTGPANITLRYNGTAWDTSSALVNTGTNIGIGVTSPSQKLEVQGNLLLSGSGTASELRLGEPSGNNYTAFKATTQSQDITYTLPNSQGSASSFLSNDGSGNLSWANPATTLRVTTVTNSNYNVASNVDVVLVNRNGNVTINLPDATSCNGRTIYIKKINQIVLDPTHDVIIDPFSTQDIDGSDRYYFSQSYTLSSSPEHSGNIFWHYDYGIQIISDGSNWWTIGEYD